MEHDYVAEGAQEFAKTVPMARLYQVIDDSEKLIATYPNRLSPHVIPALKVYKQVATQRETAYLSWIEGTD